MSYVRATDFLALLRATGNGTRTARMPGLDWLVLGMAAADMFLLWVNPTTAPPTVSDQITTVWLKTANVSYAAEGDVFMWDADSSEYVQATPALWKLLFAGVRIDRLDELSDVNVTEGPSIDGQFLKWDNDTSKWIPDVIAARLDELSDVNVTEGPGIDGQFLKWDNGTSKWIPGAGAGAGTLAFAAYSFAAGSLGNGSGAVTLVPTLIAQSGLVATISSDLITLHTAGTYLITGRTFINAIPPAPTSYTGYFRLQKGGVDVDGLRNDLAGVPVNANLTTFNHQFSGILTGVGAGDAFGLQGAFATISSNPATASSTSTYLSFVKVA